MRRRSDKLNTNTNTNTAKENETEVLKQEYLKLKQQLLELQKTKPKHRKEKSKVRAQKSHRNVDMNEKKVTINPKKQRNNSKFVRFNVDEAHDRRGKTPNHAGRDGNKFYFDDDSFEESLNAEKRFDQDEITPKQSSNKEKLKEISMQYNKSRHTNSLLICKINKVENLKIVHTSEQKQSQKHTKTKPEDRRASTGFNMSTRKQSKHSDDDSENNVSQPTINKSKPLNQNSNVSDRDKSARKRDLQDSPPKMTRNTERGNSKSKSYTHAHHVSNPHIENPRGEDGAFPYDSKLLEMSKKRHRKDMKSGDHIKQNNFKFMNVNWLNQANQQPMPYFYANQQVNGNINPSSLLLFQQQMNMGMLNNLTTPGDISSLINQSHMNNQSLLLYDKQTNSIIPINPAMIGQMNNGALPNQLFTPMNNTKIMGDESVPVSVLSTVQKQTSAESSRKDSSNNVPQYMQDAKLKLDMDPNFDKTPEPRRPKHNFETRDIDPLDLDLEYSEVQAKHVAKRPAEEGKQSTESNLQSQEASATLKAAQDPRLVKDSINSRLETGVRAIELSRLKASDFDLNNRESEAFNFDTATNLNLDKFATNTIPEEEHNFKSFMPSVAVPQESDRSKSKSNLKERKDNAKENLILIPVDENNSKDIEQKKKLFEQRLNQRNQKSKSRKKSKKPGLHDRSVSHNINGSESDSETGDEVNDSINRMPESKCQNSKVAHSKGPSIQNTPSHVSSNKARGIRDEGRHSPVMVDLFSSQDTHIVSRNPGRILESGDNPISSISSKAGFMNFRAFQADASQKPKVEEPIIIGAKDNNPNSSLADMFKTKKSNMLNKFSNREKCKSKKRPDKKPKTKEELAEIRKNMMKKRNRSTSPKNLDSSTGPQKQGKSQATFDVDLQGFKGQPPKEKSRQKCREPPPELLERLAGGKKQKVNLSI